MANLRRFRDPRLSHHLVCLYAEDYGTRAPDVPPDTPVTYLYGDGVRRAGRLQTIRRLHHAIGDLHPDLIHCSVAEASLASRIVGMTRRVPVIESLINISHEQVRTVDDPAVKRWKLRAHTMADRFTARAVTRFHALSEAVADSWQRTVGISPSRITVIPRGVDVDDLQRQGREGNSRADLGLPSAVPLILAVGRQAAQKGHRYLIAALPEVLQAVPQARLVIAGQPGNMTPDLQAMVQQLGLADTVIMVGARDDVPALLAACDVFVYPSLFEGLGVALLEAMAAGCACVTSDVPPLSEVVTDGVTGLLVPSRDPAALAAAMLRLLHDRELASALGSAARLHIASDYPLQAAADRIESLYREVLSLPA